MHKTTTGTVLACKRRPPFHTFKIQLTFFCRGLKFTLWVFPMKLFKKQTEFVETITCLFVHPLHSPFSIPTWMRTSNEARSWGTKRPANWGEIGITAGKYFRKENLCWQMRLKNRRHPFCTPNLFFVKGLVDPIHNCHGKTYFRLSKTFKYALRLSNQRHFHANLIKFVDFYPLSNQN